VDISSEAKKLMNSYLAEHPDIETIQVERFLEEGWEVLKRHPLVMSGKYILKEVAQQEYNEIVFLNVELVVKVMNANREIFARFAGTNFNAQLLIEDLKKGKHDIWKMILKDYRCLGILLGYGRENARLFERNMKIEPVKNLGPSENNDPRLQAECYLVETPFRIPIFAIFDPVESAELISKYKSERETIKSYYMNRDFLEATLTQLNK
jgi:hypothetical protein